MLEDPPAPWVNARAVAWALHEVDVPASRLATLIALASKSNGDGTPDRPKVNGWNAYPSVPTIAHMAGKGARQVERDIEWFLDDGIIRMPLDQSAAEHIPGNIRPNVYDMGYSPVRPFLDPAEAKRQREGKSTRRRPKSSHDPSSTTGHGQQTTEDPSPMTGHDPSSTTGRPVTHDEQDPSWVTGKEPFKEEEEEPIIEPAPVPPGADPAEAATTRARPHEDTRDRLRRLGVPDDEIEQFIEHVKNTHAVRTTVGAYLTAWTDHQITDALNTHRHQIARHRHEQRQRAIDRARRAAIDACPHCDHNGHRHDLNHNDHAVPCDHTPPHGPQKPPRPPEPRTEAQPPPAGVTPAQEAIARLREQKGWERKPLRGQGTAEPAERAQPPPATELPDCPKCGNVREPYGPCYGCAASATPLTARSATA